MRIATFHVSNIFKYAIALSARNIHSTRTVYIKSGFATGADRRERISACFVPILVLGVNDGPKKNMRPCRLTPRNFYVRICVQNDLHAQKNN